MMISIPRKVAQEMIAHAKDEAPNEACGLLAANKGKLAKVYRCANAEKSTTTYRLEPQEQFKAFTEIEEKGWELFGIYHSHPGSPAYPSPRDIETAYYPEAMYFIVSLLNEPHVRAFRIIEGGISEERLIMKD